MAYTTTLRNDFNTANQVGYLKRISGVKTKWDVVLEALAIADRSLHFQERGLSTRIWNKYSDGFSEFYRLRGYFSKADTLGNLRRQPADEKGSLVTLNVHPLTKKMIADIGQKTGLKNDEYVISYALQLSYDIAQEIQACKGKAILCFTNDVQLRDGAKAINTSYDKTFKASLRRTANRVKALF